MTRDRRVSNTITTVLILLTLFITAGCSNSMAAKGSDEMREAFEALMKRPNLTEVEADYQSMFATIRQRLTAEIGLAEWLPDREPIIGTSCGGYLSHLDGSGERLYNAGTSPGNLPDARWGQAVAIVTEVAGQHGFGAPKVVIDGPSDHEVLLHDAYQGRLLFGTGANTILTGGTGCHLTQEAHQRGTYQPPKY